MSSDTQNIDDLVREALDLAPELLDGDISKRDRVRLMRLVFDIADVALELQESRNQR